VLLQALTLFVLEVEQVVELQLTDEEQSELITAGKIVEAQIDRVRPLLDQWMA